MFKYQRYRGKSIWALLEYRIGIQLIFAHLDFVLITTVKQNSPSHSAIVLYSTGVIPSKEEEKSFSYT